MTESLRILVVDDDKNMAKTLVKILLTKGYSAATAYTGEEAMNLVQKDHFDCVLSDIKMPEMTGVELFKELQGYSPDLPIILMTAYVHSELLTESVANGVVAVLNKPLDYDLLFMYLSAIR